MVLMISKVFGQLQVQFFELNLEVLVVIIMLFSLCFIDKLSFPLGKQVKSSLFKLTTPSTPKQAAAEDSEQEFNYDTSTSITGMMLSIIVIN